MRGGGETNQTKQLCVGEQKSRVSFQATCRPISTGGMNFSDICHYYEVIHLSSVIKMLWVLDPPDWVSILSELTPPMSIPDVI